ncbi:amidase family protein [Aliiroseovarius sediminis]|uniref:amidase n=1 Tax=Aliiroseovarius sediminis TaxID=2925839 RepID=UPI001F584B30|nr:amidase family protein [Aliiroseovarius sediminis]MCI2395631.1 amidase family protein [Aliiroseovarius sediminis]
MTNQWLTMSMGDLGRGIGAGDIDPLALTETFLDAIKTHEFTDRIYARLTESRALAEAAAASKRAASGHRVGILDGVPISWKDLFDTAGVVTEAGSALLKDRVPTQDAAVLRNATAQGLICLGKTHMSELAFSGLGLNPVTATSPCVNDLEAVSGGSSSGAATAVAFGLAAGSVGSDTGGSVRIPAAWNDLVGLKTSGGRLSSDGTVPLAPRFDTIGPLCRTVEDTALLLAALEGGPAPDLRGASLKGVRLLVLENGLTDARDQPKAGFDSALGRLMDAGCIVKRAHLPIVDEALTMSGVLFTTEAYATWYDKIEAQPDLMFAEIRDRFRAGGQYTGVEFVRAWQRLDDIRKEYNAAVAGFDAVVLPTAPIMPPNVERLMTDHAYYIEENLMALRNTRIGNLMGSSGLTLPTGLPSTGILLQGAPMAEAQLLRLGAAAEAVLA